MGSVMQTTGESEVVVTGKGNPSPFHPLLGQTLVLILIVLNTKNQAWLNSKEFSNRDT